jgi:succinate dehydrogenase/fumarate reductase-like Fe-S protein
MALDGKWWGAQLNLAWRVIVHYARKLWPWATRYGIDRFRQNYVHEGLPPATPAMRELLVQPGRCTQCGVCDGVCPLLHDDALRDRTAPTFLGPMTFVSSGARAAPHFEDVEETVAALRGPVCQGCKACDAACPERIPILAIADLVDAQRRAIVAAQQALVPAAGG